MTKKNVYLLEIEKVRGLLGADSHDQTGINALGADIPVIAMKDPVRFARYAVRSKMSIADCHILLGWVLMQEKFLDDICVTSDITYKAAWEYYERARINTIVIHRMNYLLHECFLKVGDVLGKRLRFQVKKCYADTEKAWDGYFSQHGRSIDKAAWVTFKDFMRLSSDAVWPMVEGVYVSIRDYMIRLGYRDVELMAWCAVTLLVGKVCRHTFRTLFADINNACGVDYERCFAHDDMTGMMRGFAGLCETLGFKTGKDMHGCFVLSGFDAEESLRFRQAWRSLISAIRNDDTTDAVAARAIGYNPESQKEYEKILAEKEREQFDEGIEQLSNKFNVMKR